MIHKACAKKQGFTIVELLIVIVVIAVLATISAVAYIGVADNARASSAKSAASQVSRKLATYNVENGRYPDSLSGVGIRDSDGTTYQYSVTADSYCLTATTGDASFFSSKDKPTPTEGACSSHNQGGQSVVTNLALNPRVVAGGATVLHSNNGALSTVTRGATVPATPDGITTAAESRLADGAVHPSVLSVYNLDGLVNTAGVERSISAWVRVNADGYKVTGTTAKWDDSLLEANKWTRVQTSEPIPANTHSVIQITKVSGNAASTDRAWITGAMSVPGSRHYPFFDGSSPGWTWSGTPNSSSSTGPVS